MERDERAKKDFANFVISTHTLTWSVTNVCSSLNLFCLISTHTLTWSVTPIDCYTLGNLSISTHTLTWSVTVDDKPYRHDKTDFNSHAHVERDKINY